MLLGLAGERASYLREWLDRLERPSTSACNECVNPDCGHALAVVSNGGAAGAAMTSGEVHIGYVGAFHEPLPAGAPAVDLTEPDAVCGWLLHRYRTLRHRFMDDVIGHYAVAVTDAASRELLLAVDPQGARKLFIHEDGGRLKFSSSLAAIGRIPPAGIPLDRTLEDFLLAFEFLPWERTPLERVKHLRPGTLMCVSSNGVTRDRIRARTFSVERSGNASGSEASLTEALADALHTSVLDQAPAGGKIGVLLGGVDSAFIAACLARAGRDVETFTFHFDDSRYNQPFCENIAEHLGIRHNWVPITPGVIRDGLHDYSRLFNQVSAIPHYVIQTAHVCRAMRARGITRALTGDGCDEIFLGYPSVYRRARLFMRLPSLPSALTGAAEAALANPFVEDRLGHLARFSRNYLHILSRAWPARGHISNRIYDEHSLRRIRTDPPPAQDAEAEEILATLADGLESLSPLRLAYHGKASVGLNKIKMEGSACASGVSLLSPYQHPRMLALAATLPEAMLRNSSDSNTAATGKYIFFRTIEQTGFLPRQVIYQKKASPVNAPVDYWYMNELRPFMLDALQDLPFRHDAAYVERMLTLKMAEEWFRSSISLARSIFHPVALLATYANLHRTLRST